LQGYTLWTRAYANIYGPKGSKASTPRRPTPTNTVTTRHLTHPTPKRQDLGKTTTALTKRWRHLYARTFNPAHTTQETRSRASVRPRHARTNVSRPLSKTTPVKLCSGYCLEIARPKPHWCRPCARTSNLTTFAAWGALDTDR